jgi:ubiquinone/menaquinone biosynthesis C-methylase UbiE
VLKEWRRVLKKGGLIRISVPDFDASVRLYLKCGLVPWVQYLIWGDQKHELNFHYINFTWPVLSHFLYQSGFENPRRVARFPYGKDASAHIDNKEGKPISLNVEAVA